MRETRFDSRMTSRHLNEKDGADDAQDATGTQNFASQTDLKTSLQRIVLIEKLCDLGERAQSSVWKQPCLHYHASIFYLACLSPHNERVHVVMTKFDG